MKFYHFVAISRKVEQRFPVEIVRHHRNDAQAGFNALILDISGIYIVVFIGRTRRRGQRKKLVFRIRFIIG